MDFGLLRYCSSALFLSRPPASQYSNAVAKSRQSLGFPRSNFAKRPVYLATILTIWRLVGQHGWLSFDETKECQEYMSVKDSFCLEGNAFLPSLAACLSFMKCSMGWPMAVPKLWTTDSLPVLRLLFFRNSKCVVGM